MASQVPDHTDNVFKIVVTGNSGVGKTSLHNQFLHGKFERHDSDGVDFGSKVVNVASKSVKLKVWDTAGQERFRSVTRNYYRGATGVLIAYDITSRETYNALAGWLTDARELTQSNVLKLVMLVGNKKDLEEARAVTFTEASSFAQENELSFLETSALTGENVEEVFLECTRSILSKIEADHITLQCFKMELKVMKDGNRIPVLGLGTWMGTGQAVSCALKHGYRLIDTATLYQNEGEVGRAIRQSGIPREEIFVVTKVWDTDHGKEKTVKAFTESLKKFGLDYIDLYLMHSAMGGKTVETWDAMVELKEKGLIKSIGVANFNVHHLKELNRARPLCPPAVNQIEIHPFLWWEECVSYCHQEGIAVMAYSPLAKAMKLNNPTLVSIAEKYRKSPAQIMIRWSLQHGFICIPKTNKEQRMAENRDVFDFEISSEDMQVLNGLDEQFVSDWPGAMTHPWEQ